MKQYGPRAHGRGEDGRAGTRAGRRAERAGREGEKSGLTRALPLARGPAGSITLTLISLPLLNFQR